MSILSGVDQCRNAAADAAGVLVEAEGGALAGSATTATGRWASGGQYVGYLGNGGTLTIPRGAGAAHAGQYQLTIGYAQADKNTGHPYNADTITRFLDVTETGGGVPVRHPYRHNYTWDGFWAETSPIDLVTPDGAIVLGNDIGWAPNIDWVMLSPLSLR